MTTVRDALEGYLAINGFTKEAYDAPTVPIPIGPFTIQMPNTAGRKSVVRLHDLHHVATGYGTDLTGEAEIGAWELRAGCTNFATYFYNGLAVMLGLFIAPVRTVRAFVSARGARTLYRVDLAYDAALALPVAELRARLGVPLQGVAREPARLHGAAPARS